jgi:hypothetical protein
MEKKTRAVLLGRCRARIFRRAEANCQYRSRPFRWNRDEKDHCDDVGVLDGFIEGPDRDLR